VARIATLVVLAMLLAPTTVRAQDLEAEAWPEFDIWIKMDETGKNRLFILASFADEPKFQYEETALGVSWDQRFHQNWSWRVGARYVWKAVDPPDKNETRVVLDLKWFHDFGGGWLLSDRNRLDLRRFDTWGQRQRVIAGVSVPIVRWASVDVFYGYHSEIKPKKETGGALGIARL